MTRAHDKVLRVARTIADLDQSAPIRSMHLNEAINFLLPPSYPPLNRFRRHGVINAQGRKDAGRRSQ